MRRESFHHAMKRYTGIMPCVGFSSSSLLGCRCRDWDQGEWESREQMGNRPSNGAQTHVRLDIHVTSNHITKLISKVISQTERLAKGSHLSIYPASRLSYITDSQT